MAHHEKGQVSNLSFFVVHHPSELVTRQTSLPSFVNLRSKFLPRAPIANGYGKRQYSVLLQDTEVCRRTPACGKRQYSKTVECFGEQKIYGYKYDDCFGNDCPDNRLSEILPPDDTAGVVFIKSS